MKTVWIYVDTSRRVGERDHLNVFASRDVADAWFAEHDPEGVAFEYDVMDGPSISCPRARRKDAISIDLAQ